MTVAPTAAAPLDPATCAHVSRLLAGFEPIERIGGRAGGAVLLARSPDRERVVVKVADTPTQAEALRLEATVGARCRHDHLVEVVGIVEDGGATALVLEHVDGTPLSSFRGRQLPPAAVAEVTTAVAGALDALHDDGWVHGDVGPQNVVVEPTGRHRLIDLGLARRRPAAVTGPLFATADYLAPEAISRPAILDRASDVYALAVVAYEMLAGQLPYPPAADDRDRCRQHLALDPIPLALVCPWLPAGVVAAVHAGMDRRHEHRPRTAGAFARLLEAST